MQLEVISTQFHALRQWSKHGIGCGTKDKAIGKLIVHRPTHGKKKPSPGTHPSLLVLLCGRRDLILAVSAEKNSGQLKPWAAT